MQPNVYRCESLSFGRKISWRRQKNCLLVSNRSVHLKFRWRQTLNMCGKTVMAKTQQSTVLKESNIVLSLLFAAIYMVLRSSVNSLDEPILDIYALSRQNKHMYLQAAVMQQIVIFLNTRSCLPEQHKAIPSHNNTAALSAAKQLPVLPPHTNTGCRKRTQTGGRRGDWWDAKQHTSHAMALSVLYTLQLS